jgi:hypothetical protein
MISSNQSGRNLGQRGFKSIEGQQQPEICEEEGLEAQNETANSGEII